VFPASNFVLVTTSFTTENFCVVSSPQPETQATKCEQSLGTI
jgi:hypothetical protein